MHPPESETRTEKNDRLGLRGTSEGLKRPVYVCCTCLQFKRLSKPKHDAKNIGDHQVKADQRVESITRPRPSDDKHLRDEGNLCTGRKEMVSAFAVG